MYAIGIMRTTIALDSEVRDRLLDLKRTWKARSIEEVIVRLAGSEPRGARALYEHRRKQVDAVVRKYRVQGLTAFGSRARGDARPDSDLDLAGDVPEDLDLYGLVHLQDELSAAFGVRVHFTPRKGLAKRVASRVADEGILLHA